MSRFIVIFSLFSLWSTNVLAIAQDSILRPTPIVEAPVLDGNLDDPAWEKAIKITNFKTYEPDFGMDMPQKTVVYITSDANNIYFAFNCFDDPNLIKTSIAPRDRIEQDDWVRISLDSYNDNQTMARFYVNPNGIQMDTRASGFRDDPGIDFVWYSAGKINDTGYTVEMRIPFKSLRYTRVNDKVTMGMVFERFISRYSINGTFPEIDPRLGNNFQLQTIEVEYSDVGKNTLVEVLPSVTYGIGQERDQGEFVKTGGKPDAGITGKIGLTSELVIDATVNPDFSQVEADVGQIDNNQRVSLFFPERRPFFQEGSENFNFVGGGRSEGPRQIVNTRTIVNPLVATKLTGKIGSKNRIAAIYALDELYPDADYPDKFANVGVIRYRRNLTDDSYVGLFGTHRLDNGRFNHVIGSDAQYRFNRSNTLSGHFFQSYDLENKDSTDTKGHSAAMEYEYSVRKISARFRVYDFSPDFISTTGNIARVGVTRIQLFLNPKYFFDNQTFQRLENWISLSQMHDKFSGLWEKSYFFNTRLAMIRNTSLGFAFNIKDEIYQGLRFNRNNIRIEARSQITKRINLELRYNYGKLIRYLSEPDIPYSGTGGELRGEINVQVNDKINSQWRISHSNFVRDSDGGLDFDRLLVRARNTYQVNKFLFFRSIVQYDSKNPEISADILASFTLIPGTVVHIGYGNLQNKMDWNFVDEEYQSTLNDYRTFRHGMFFKASYLFRNK